jgi:DegV family protein with EDD domain
MDGDTFASALRSGIHRVIGEQETLNRINVFPVADGDTGTNLSLSLGTAFETLARPESSHLGKLLENVADALLDGARGNSGAIIAQFFQGLSDSVGEASRFSPRTFSAAVNLGNDYAHGALSDPREGTILSVIAVFADSLHRRVNAEEPDDFPAIFQTAVASAQDALAKTEEQLDVLKKAGVVDAGAKGFVAMLEGFAEFIVHGRIAEKPDYAELHLDAAIVETAGDADDLRFRYCTECIITGTDIDRRKLRESLSDMGNSLVLAGTKRKAKIHIHVNSPEDVFLLARRYGQVSGEKSDDMHRQQHSTHEIQQKFAVITDSAADISDDDMERLDIHMVPVRIQFGERGYLDKVSITANEFFEELARNPVNPTTSQPSPGEFRRQFQFLASHFPDVVSINLMPSVSGTFQAAKSAAERTSANGRIHVVNSHNVSLGQGLIAVYAAECADRGLDVDTALAFIEKIIPATHTFGIVKDLRYAVRGGRIPSWVKKSSDLLAVTPVLHIKQGGRIRAAGVLLGRDKRISKFARLLAKRLDDRAELAIGIGHALCEDDALELERQLRELLPNIVRCFVTPLGSGIGAHGGPGTIAVAAQYYVDPGKLQRPVMN